MITVNEKLCAKISYPIENIADVSKVLFFDIETTGFSREYCNVYLIGCMYFSKGNTMYIQWLAENFDEEKEILLSFRNFSKDFDAIIHFNGDGFDIPFLEERGKKYHIDFQFDRFKNIDIYKPLSKINHILKLENMRQKTFEQKLGIGRIDPFSGGDLVEIFRQYVETKDEKLLPPILLHNMEDVKNMGSLLSLLSFVDLMKHKFVVDKYEIKEFKNVKNINSKELCLTLRLFNPLPFSISYGYNEIYIKGNENFVKISIAIKSGTYKYFFPNYRDYFYLPEEDRAIHKSLAQFVEKKYRRQALASNCYEKHSGDFLPIYGKSDLLSPIFRASYNDKNTVVKTDFLNDDTVMSYACMIVDFVMERPKKKAGT